MIKKMSMMPLRLSMIHGWGFFFVKMMNLLMKLQFTMWKLLVKTLITSTLSLKMLVMSLLTMSLLPMSMLTMSLLPMSLLTMSLLPMSLLSISLLPITLLPMSVFIDQFKMMMLIADNIDCDLDSDDND